jgi:hypothetical protein
MRVSAPDGNGVALNLKNRFTFDYPKSRSIPDVDLRQGKSEIILMLLILFR